MSLDTKPPQRSPQRSPSKGSPSRSGSLGKALAGTAVSKKARMALLAAVVTTVLLYAVPYGRYLIYPLMLLSTLVHEMGHGIAALLVGGRFHSFRMWPDGSGVAMWSAEAGRLRLAIVAMGGLIGPAVVAAAAFAGARVPRRARQMLGLGALLLAVSLLLVVRGVFGWIFVSILAAGLFLLSRRASDDTAQVVVVFLALQLTLAVFSRSDYLFMADTQTAQGIMPSDVSRIAEALWLPYWFWGIACAAVSLWVLVVGLRSFWR